jgi:hypothetical protein
VSVCVCGVCVCVCGVCVCGCPLVLCQHVAHSFTSFEYLFFPHKGASGANALLTGVTVAVANVNADLQLGVDESYVLDIPADKATITITANTVYGAYHGLQTLSQLIVFDFDSKVRFECL